MLRVHRLGLLAGDTKELVVEQIEVLVEEVSISCVGLDEYQHRYLIVSTYRDKHRSFVRPLRMVEGIHLKSVARHLPPQIPFLGKKVPELAGTGGAWDTASHAHNDCGVAP